MSTVYTEPKYCQHCGEELVSTTAQYKPFDPWTGKRLHRQQDWSVVYCTNQHQYWLKEGDPSHPQWTRLVDDPRLWD